MVEQGESPNIYDPIEQPKEWAAGVIDLAIRMHSEHINQDVAAGRLPKEFTTSELVLITLAASILEGFHIIPRRASADLIIEYIDRAQQEARLGRHHPAHCFTVNTDPSSIAG